MFSTLRTRFGIPGVISVMALVFAMFGGAYAASNSSDGGKATASAKAKQGPRGKTGKTGPAGPAGPQGPAGAAGPAGPKGDPGAAGSPGANGVSVTSEEFAGEEGPCEEGGSEFTSASPDPTYACNGKEGPEGPRGEPWTPEGTLPEGATETGTWGSFGVFLYQEEEAIAFQISFPIPLAPSAEAGDTAPPNKAAVQHVYVGPGEDKSAQGCPGYVDGIPTADPGKLCLYADQLEKADREGFSFSNPAFTSPTFGLVPAGYSEGVGTTGTVFNVLCEDECSASGNWAVTAP